MQEDQKKPSLMEFVQEKFPCSNSSSDSSSNSSDSRKKMSYLVKRDKEKKFETWKDFTSALAAYEAHGDSTVVEQSSSWAVCQEFLGNLEGSELGYAQGRGGIWEFTEDDKGRVEIVTVRQVLNALRQYYPV